MNIAERRAELVNQINAINDEKTLEMLSETLAFYTHNEGRDVTDDLDESQLNELIDRMNEPVDKDTVSEEEFKKLFSRWSTK